MSTTRGSPGSVSAGSGGGKSEIKVPTDSGSGGDPPPGSLCPHRVLISPSSPKAPLAFVTPHRSHLPFTAVPLPGGAGYLAAGLLGDSCGSVRSSLAPALLPEGPRSHAQGVGMVSEVGAQALCKIAEPGGITGAATGWSPGFRGRSWWGGGP